MLCELSIVLNEESTDVVTSAGHRPSKKKKEKDAKKEKEKVRDGTEVEQQGHCPTTVARIV